MLPTSCLPRSRSSPFLLSIFATSLLAACSSGGGGGSSAPANPPAPAPAPGPGNAPPAAPAFARLWAPNYNAAQLRAWSLASLQADRTNAPDVVIDLPAGARPNAAAFDATGALWVTDEANTRLFKFGRAQLAASGQPTPQVVIETDGASLASPIGLAFDRSANLWVAAGNRLEMYAPSNLDQSGPTTPDRVLTAVGIDIAAGIVFDAAGNLWLGNASTVVASNSILVFTPDQQAAGGTVVPRLTLRSAAFALVEGIQFDSRGALWIASNDGLNIARFGAASVAVPATSEDRTIVPEASLEADGDDSAAGRSVRKPGGIVFDRDGNLFATSQRGNQGETSSGVLRFNAAQLTFLGGRVVSAAVLVAQSMSNPGYGGLCLELP